MSPTDLTYNNPPPLGADEKPEEIEIVSKEHTHNGKPVPVGHKLTVDAATARHFCDVLKVAKRTGK